MVQKAGQTGFLIAPKTINSITGRDRGECKNCTFGSILPSHGVYRREKSQLG